MKYTINFNLILCGFLCALLAASCVKEGPMGPPGADGQDGTDGRDGVDGNISCMACHSTENMESIQAEFSMSVHRAGLNAVDYAGARGPDRGNCTVCHSHEGFVQYAEFGEVLGDITNPTAWKCNTCHGIHETFETTDYALRLSDPIQPIYNPESTMDLLGNSNLCANCHQSRAPEPNLSNPGEETFHIARTHYGPHYSTQGNIVAGVGFAEIEGSVEYPAAGSSAHLNQASCTGCHMGEYGNGGGHTWIPNLDACNSCHNTNLDDFNYGTTRAEVASKLTQLKEKLVELGVMALTDHGHSPVVGTHPMIVARAYFNYDGIYKDRSLGAHNPKYMKALLTNTLEALEDYD